MTGSVKQKALIAIGLAMIIMVIIAASLPQLELQPGMPLPRLENDQMVISPMKEEPFVAISINEFFKVFFILVLVVSTLYLLYKMITGASWKEFRSIIQPVLVISLIIGGFLFLMVLLLTKPGNTVTEEIPIPIATPPVTSPLGPVPVSLLWLVGIGLLVISTITVFWIFGFPTYKNNTIDLVGLEAKKAWQAIKTGGDLKDVIINCYRQMSHGLEEEQGIERKNFMTTREFETLLEATGIPHDPIHQLTQLFEAVRYGNWQPNPEDEQKAIHCLEAIMLYSQAALEKS
jgi:hypothetical protein